MRAARLSRTPTRDGEPIPDGLAMFKEMLAKKSEAGSEYDTKFYDTEEEYTSPDELSSSNSRNDFDK